jgi:SLT domain-containing protein
VVQQAIQVASVASGGVETIVNQAASNSGWGSSEIAAFDWIIEHESGFRVNATNPTSSAYGICQSLPGNKMASAGADWQTNPRTQAIWCIGYIKSSYGDALNAKSFWLIHRWF